MPPVEVASLPRGVVKVRDQVYMGPDAAVADMVRSHGCVGIVSCLAELSENDRAALYGGVRVLHYALEDRSDAVLLDNFSRVIDFITGFIDTSGDAAEDDTQEPQEPVPQDEDSSERAVAESTEKPATAATASDATAVPTTAPPAVPDPARPCIFLHCHAGTSRAPAVALALLMTVDNVSLKEAFAALAGGEEAPVATKPSPNPGFMYQLVKLDTDLHGTCDFDLTGFFIDSLCRLFPHASRDQVVEAYKASGGDIGATRNVLMRQFASAFVDKDKIMIDLLTNAVAQQAIPRKVVARIYEEEGRNRDKALLRLLKLQPDEIVELLSQS